MQYFNRIIKNSLYNLHVLLFKKKKAENEKIKKS